MRLRIQDEIGGVTTTNTLTLTASGADTINGAASIVLSDPRASLDLVSDGVSKYTFATTSLVAIGEPNTVKVWHDGRRFYDAKQHGVRPEYLAAANVPAMQALIVTALAAGVKDIYLSAGTYDLTGIDQSIHDVRLIGPGQITGVYRKQVEPLVSNTFKPPPTLNPTRHMRRFLARSNPVVVITGDSLSRSNFPGTLDAPFPALDDAFPRNGVFEHVSRALREAYPEKDITIYDRGIGASRMIDLNRTWAGILGLWPTWYTDHEKPWLDYIHELNPDLIVIAFGMNCGSDWAGPTHVNFLPTEFMDIMDKIHGWKKDPDIVFSTSFVPALDSRGYTKDFGTETEQEGRDAIAGFVRSFTRKANYGLIDINRTFNVFRDGRDVVSTGYNGAISTVTQNIPYSPANKVRDFRLTAAFTSITSTFWDISGAGTSPITIPLSSDTNNVAQISDASGFLKFVIYTQTTTGLRQYEEVSTIATPATGTDVTLDIDLKGPWMKVMINGAVLYNGPVIRYGGVFTPAFKYAGSESGMSGTFKFVGGEEAKYASVLLDPEIYDLTIPGTISKNHPAAAVQERVIGTTLAAQPIVGAVRMSAEEELLALLGSDRGLAIDFTMDHYVRRDVLDPSKNASGPVSDIITGTPVYTTHPVTGERVGLRVEGSSDLPYIPLANVPFSESEGTMLLEGFQEVSAISYFAVISTSAGGANKRIQLFSPSGPTVSALVVDNSNADAANMALSAGAYNKFGRMAVAWKENSFAACANGRVLAKDYAGSPPTGLDRIRFGTAGAVATNAVIIRKLVVIPRRLSVSQIMARTS